ncbi:molybdenum cofactor biosynthesis protein MoaE [Rubripirellula amarantea]|uniref:Molybdopterin synthase catalytic subunit n=1 Tax=Rubripirellula amarantea TaxID=2527999 RepID=A0A5C5WVA9_9BACT|nr:molybdenum cofactor biosynthesis protein MoaE [Rubripirellula amarantea]MDA8743766.1 molybdenum cofactor biosynthesis protein MoaE [Rubripirellula amarantea]TWT54637.1 Molybdopterin synthase catalytic subunit [Rubripirellula amarantea]
MISKSKHNLYFVGITSEPIDAGSLAAYLDDPDVGAHGWFHGVTRRTTGNLITSLLSYEAHQAMAINQLESLARDAVKKFGLSRVVIVHRIGEVPVGESSVVMGCSSPHRVNVFAALPWMMDLLKKDVPIWKQETFEDGTRSWVHPDPTDHQ